MTATATIEVSSEVLTITPKIAGQWLANNPRNRAVVAQRVTLYAQQMERGAWRLNGEPIIIADDGSLLDGQHRLLACQKANTSFRALVVRGVDAEVFPTIDQCRPRALDDVISIDGTPRHEAFCLAGAVRLMFWLEQGLEGTNIGSGSRNIAVDQLLDVLARHPNLRSSMKFATKHYPSHFRGLVGSTVVTFMHYCGHEYAAEHGPSEFWLSVGDGANLELGDPALTLRRLLISRDPSMYAGTAGRTITLAYCLKAWNAHCEGEKVQMFRLGRKVTLPLPFGYKLPKS